MSNQQDLPNFFPAKSRNSDPGDDDEPEEDEPSDGDDGSSDDDVRACELPDGTVIPCPEDEDDDSLAPKIITRSSLPGINPAFKGPVKVTMLASPEEQRDLFVEAMYELAETEDISIDAEEVLSRCFEHKDRPKYLETIKRAKALRRGDRRAREGLVESGFPESDVVHPSIPYEEQDWNLFGIYGWPVLSRINNSQQGIMGGDPARFTKTERHLEKQGFTRANGVLICDLSDGAFDNAATSTDPFASHTESVKNAYVKLAVEKVRASLRDGRTTFVAGNDQAKRVLPALFKKADVDTRVLKVKLEATLDGFDEAGEPLSQTVEVVTKTHLVKVGSKPFAPLGVVYHNTSVEKPLHGKFRVAMDVYVEFLRNISDPSFSSNLTIERSLFSANSPRGDVFAPIGKQRGGMPEFIIRATALGKQERETGRKIVQQDLLKTEPELWDKLVDYVSGWSEDERSAAAEADADGRPRSLQGSMLQAIGVVFQMRKLATRERNASTRRALRTEPSSVSVADKAKLAKSEATNKRQRKTNRTLKANFKAKDPVKFQKKVTAETAHKKRSLKDPKKRERFNRTMRKTQSRPAYCSVCWKKGMAGTIANHLWRARTGKGDPACAGGKCISEIPDQRVIENRTEWYDMEWN